MTDGRIATLKKADPERISAAQKRYQEIATTLDDAVAKLAKIVDAGGDGLRGKYVEPLKKSAGEIRDSLTKAAVRYEDVATEMGKYQPELQHAITEVAAAEREESDGLAAQTRANGLPDPVKGQDGTISPEEQAKGTDKQRAQSEATGQINAAKNRLTAALDALDVAGKRFGDAVNCKKYDDGLTDTTKDKINAVLKIISKVFQAIAIALCALAILLPGVNMLVFAGLAAGAVGLIADSVLLAHGEGSVLDVVFGALGLGLGGLGLAIGQLSRGVAAGTKYLTAFKWKPTANWGPGGPIPLPNWGQGLAALPAKPGFFSTEWMNLKNISGVWGNLFKTGNFGQFGKGWASGVMGVETFKALTTLGGFTEIKGLWTAWAGANLLFNLGPGLAYAGGRAAETIPDV